MIENICLAQKIIQIGPVIEILWQIVDFCIVNGGHLEKWRSFCKFAWLTIFFERVITKEHICQFWCLYHYLHDWSHISTLSAALLLLTSFILNTAAALSYTDARKATSQITRYIDPMLME